MLRIDGLDTFKDTHVLVVGDVMLDRYCWGDVDRISPEAPVPIFHVRRRSEIPGGAGNVVSNLTGLGASVTLIGIRGNDEAGAQLSKLLTHEKIDLNLFIDDGRPTITKTRIVSQGQQMVRLDEEELFPVDPDLQARMIDLIQSRLPQCNAIILSDYGKGLLRDQLLVQSIIALAGERHIPVIVDPKGREWERYRGATCVTPNTKELETLCGDSLGEDAKLVEAMKRTIAQYGLSSLLVTRGPLGMCLMDRSETPIFIPTLARQVFDVSGAGDTVTATLSLCVAEGYTPTEAAKIANLAAGIVVAKVGTQPINSFELKAAMNSTGVDAPVSTVTQKLTSLSAAITQCESWKTARQRIVFTNGCFDLLHPGHVHLLNEAKSFGDRLIVAINSDTSIMRLKGPQRPIVAEHDRASLIAALHCVDLVVIFHSDTPEELLRLFRPHVLVKGENYRQEDVLGRRIVESNGGTVRLVPLIGGYSTANIAWKVKESGRVVSGSC
jgi:D-beta-D-heptose 7-phosphate kinase / D-beta-D-heptose 1-phosphate adenosyltransferase